MKASSPDVRLRPITLNDVDHIMTWVNDRDVVGNFSGFKHPISREDELAFLEKTLASENDRLFAVETTDGVYLGNLGVHQIHWPSRVGRLALIIGNKEYWGRGIGQKSIRMGLDWAFEQANLHKVWIIFFASNARMHHICKKTGFIQEGVLREEYFHRGAYHDMIRMSILQREWLPAPA